jgi:hypothetical protein
MLIQMVVSAVNSERSLRFTQFVRKISPTTQIATNGKETFYARREERRRRRPLFSRLTSLFGLPLLKSLTWVTEPGMGEGGVGLEWLVFGVMAGDMHVWKCKRAENVKAYTCKTIKT